jgi:opacity protein-like surface antigen
MQMRLSRSAPLLLLCSAALVAVASPASAQYKYKHLAGGYLAGSFPMGDWGKIAGFGLALDGTDVVHKAEKPLSWRVSSGLLYNFSRTESVPKANIGVNDKLDLETKNWSLLFGLGPEFSKPGPVSPFIYGTVGFDTYWTSSTLSGTVGGLPYSSEHGDSRIAFAWAGGLGVRRHVTSGTMGELSVEYRSGIDHMFILPDEVKTSGTTVLTNRESRSSDQIIVRLGTVLGY